METGRMVRVGGGGGGGIEGSARCRSGGAARFTGRGAQGLVRVGPSGRFAASLFLYAHALPAGTAGTNHRAALSPEHGERRRRDARTNMARLACTVLPITAECGA